MDRVILLLVNLWAYLVHWRLMVRYRRMIGRFPNPAYPRTFNEKLLWRKLFDHNPLFTVFSDRLQGQDYMRERCPELAIAERLWIGDRARDLPGELLTMPVVVKANHGSAMSWFAEPGRAADRTALERTFDEWLSRRFGEKDHEWGYFNVRRRLYVERALHDEAGGPFLDVKVHAFDGKPAICMVFTDWTTPHRRYAIYDGEGNRVQGQLTGKLGDPTMVLPETFRPPPSLREIIASATKISQGCDYLRADFMQVNGRLHAGEITTYCLSGYLRYDEPRIESALADAWDLRKSWFLSTPQRGWRRIYAKALSARLTRANDRPTLRRSGSPPA